MYDLIIIGLGPAGLTASIYAACHNLTHLTIGKVTGGQMSLAHNIINYPGFESISGKELSEKMLVQAKNGGAEIVNESVVKIEKISDPQQNQSFKVETETGKTFEAKTIIIATGMEKRKLNIPGENEYTGKGIFYCAPCEKLEYTDKITAVVGGGNSAVSSAILISHSASKVYLIHRGKELRCDSILLEQLTSNPKIEILYDSQLLEILGDGEKVTGIKIKSSSSTSNFPSSPNLPNPPSEIPLDKVYIEIGGVPGSSLIIPLGVKLDEKGFIMVDENLMTNIPGVFAAGDIISSKLSIEQIASAIGLGARASLSVYYFLKQKKSTSWGQSVIQR